MKNFLLFNYSIEPENIIKISDDIYTFYIDYNKYYFIRIKNVQDDIEKIYNLTINIINKFHLIIKTRLGKIICEYEKMSFILLKIISPENDEIMLKDIVDNEIEIIDKTLNYLNRSNWGLLWSEKIDYLEYQVSELGKGHPLVTRSFSYYVGLEENAISYFNLLKIENINLYLNRRRIRYPNISLNFNNPLNIVVDYKVRDIGEYIKFAFFENADINNEIDWLIEKNILSPLEYNLLFVRLLYPSYYFDELRNVIEKNQDDDTLLKYINKVDEYEYFLKNLYYKISKKCTLIRIDWIIKKREL